MIGRALVLATALALAACAGHAPPPVPPPLPWRAPTKRLAPADVARLKAEIAGDRARLAAYRALPICAPSGAVECRDDKQADAATAAEQSAAEALRSRLPTARNRVSAFRAAVKKLPEGSPPP